MIKKMLFASLGAIVLISGMTAGTAHALNSLEPTPAVTVGPYEGVFTGVLAGDNNSFTPISLKMTHQDGLVNGILYLGEGFYVDAGLCGGAALPAMTQSASGKTQESDPREMQINSSLDLHGFQIGVFLTSSLSADGNTLNVSTTIDLPWFCGRDPYYSGMLTRIQ